jgi:predicted nucleic acid-binding protein
LSSPLTVDASVFVSAFSSAEPHHRESAGFLRTLGERPRPLILPTLVKPEIAGAVLRRTGNAQFARGAAELGFLGGQVVFVALDAALADEATDLAASSGLRGADAVYAATARRFDAILVTLDNEQQDKLPADVVARRPGEVEST